jgi:exonuclease SbcD
MNLTVSGTNVLAPVNHTRLLATTDWHIRDTAPSRRKDDFLEAQWKKVRRVGEIAKLARAKAIIHSGDLFDVQEPSLGLVYKTIHELEQYTCPMYVVPGNHDIFGRNLQTLSRCGLGLVFKSKVARMLTGKVVIDDVTLVGCSAEDELNVNPILQALKGKSTKYLMAVCHWMLTNHFVRFPHTLVQDLAPKLAGVDVVMSGDWHSSFVEQGRPIFFNPGNLTRQSIVEAKQTPSVTIVDFLDSGIVLTKALLGAELFVMDMTKVANVEEDAEVGQDFLRELSSASMEQIDLENALEVVATSKGIDAPIVTKSKESIREAEVRLR